MYRLIPYVLILILLSGCRARKATIKESYNQFSTDTTTLSTSDTSVTNITEDTRTLHLSDETGERIEFQQKGGEIHFHPDGTVTLTGVAAYGIKNRKSATQLSTHLSVCDTITSLTQTESSRQTETVITHQSDKRNSGSFHNWAICLVVVLLLGVIATSYVMRVKMP